MLIDIITILGTFLLAVEAIKLRNLIILRKKYMVTFREIINPRIEWVDGEPSKKAKSETRRFFLIWGILLISVGTISNILLLKLAFIQYYFGKVGNVYYEILIFVLIAFLSGAVIWTFLIYFLKFMELLLIKIESHTESGVIGIIGFLFILSSYIIKWITSPTI